MTNDQNNNLSNTQSQNTSEIDNQTENGDFGEVSQAQTLGGGKGQEGGQKIGQFGDDDFTQTDQSISQAAPGQTATNTNQGGSNA